MKRSRGTKHRTKPPESAFLTEAKRLVTVCAVQGTPQSGEYLVPTPHGTVKFTMRAEVLVHTAPSPIARPS